MAATTVATAKQEKPYEGYDVESVGLYGTQVTDAGLAHLQGLKAVQVLELHGTQVTDVGLAQFRQALPNCAIDGP